MPVFTSFLSRCTLLCLLPHPGAPLISGPGMPWDLDGSARLTGMARTFYHLQLGNHWTVWIFSFGSDSYVSQGRSKILNKPKLFHDVIPGVRIVQKCEKVKVFMVTILLVRNLFPLCHITPKKVFIYLLMFIILSKIENTWSWAWLCATAVSHSVLTGHTSSMSRPQEDMLVICCLNPTH